MEITYISVFGAAVVLAGVIAVQMLHTRNLKQALFYTKKRNTNLLSELQKSRNFQRKLGCSLPSLKSQQAHLRPREYSTTSQGIVSSFQLQGKVQSGGGMQKTCPSTLLRCLICTEGQREECMYYRNRNRPWLL